MDEELAVHEIFDRFAERGRFLKLAEDGAEWVALYPVIGFGPHGPAVRGRTRLGAAERAWAAFCHEDDVRPAA
jgi:hypothetical protein